MAEGGNSGFTKRLKQKIAKNDIRIKELEDQVQGLEADLKDHKENCVGKIKALKDEIQTLKIKNCSMHKKLDQMNTEFAKLKYSHDWLEEVVETTKEELKTTKQKLKDHDQRIKGFELSEDQICIAQLCTSLQKNMCKIVLGDKFDDYLNHNPKYMEDHITNLIKDEDERRAARDKWESLKKEIGWNPYLVTTLKPIRDERNEYTHRTPTEESIKDAKDNLKKKGKLNENMTKAVDMITKMWKQTNTKLSNGKNVVQLPPSQLHSNMDTLQKLEGTGQPRGIKESKASEDEHCPHVGVVPKHKFVYKRPDSGFGDLY